jgi:glycosyltransferase involved in cell wall biosynthesis
MKISILAPNLSNNSLGRAWVLAKILKRRYEVEIVGPSYGKGIWKPLEGDDLAYKVVDEISSIGITRKSLKLLNGDVIYSSKPLFFSFGVGLIKKWFDQIPLVLDVDDWELGFSRDKIRIGTPLRTARHLTGSLLFPLSNSSLLSIAFLEYLTSKADQTTVSGIFLQKKFGGTIIWHARDTDFLDPEKYKSKIIRELYGLPSDKKIVMFLGTVREHKGIEDVLYGLSLLRNSSVMFVLVGLSNGTYREKLKHLCDINVIGGCRFFDMQPFAKLPEFLSMSDVIVIPQRRNLATVGQVPAKVFDAMAMAKPIISTSVSDIPEILEGCGWVVEPGNPEKLADALVRVLSDPSNAKEKGQLARKKCVDKYSWNAMEPVLANLFNVYS